MQRISLLVVVKAVLVALVELEVLEEAFVLQYNKKAEICTGSSGSTGCAAGRVLRREW